MVEIFIGFTESFKKSLVDRKKEGWHADLMIEFVQLYDAGWLGKLLILLSLYRRQKTLPEKLQEVDRRAEEMLRDKELTGCQNHDVVANAINLKV